MSNMNSRLKLKVFIFAVIVCLTILFLVIKNGAIPLGLDLQGGTYLLLDAKSKDGSPVTNSLMNEAIAVIRGRVDSGGTREAEITRESGNRVRVSIPGAEGYEEVFDLLHHEGLFEVFELITTVPPKEVTSEDQITVGRRLLSGDFLEHVEAGYNEANKPTVFFTYTPEACQILSDFFTVYRDRPTKDTLDGKLLFYSRYGGPDPIPELFRNAQLTGPTLKEAQRIANIFKSGIMPVKLSAVEERTIRPSLGKDSLQKILVAGVVGVFFVLLFMAVAYRKFGLMANIALISYLVIVMFLLIMFKVTFSLAGIAGLILGIGMAVDANIIIFERIKEEMTAEVSLLECLEIGFSQAKATIIDSNTTTLLVAAVLMLFGSGIVRGFAVILGISIVVSMFSALNISRWLLTWAVDGLIISNYKVNQIKGSRL